NTIEAMPQRVQRKQAAAEEPVTARIRRKTAGITTPDPAIQPTAPESTAGALTPPESTAEAIPGDHSHLGVPTDHAGTTRNGAVMPQLTFQERLEMERGWN